MNYVSAVLGIFVIILLGIWLGYRREYQGPEFGIILGGGMLQQQNIDGVIVSNKNIGSEKM